MICCFTHKSSRHFLLILQQKYFYACFEIKSIEEKTRTVFFFYLFVSQWKCWNCLKITSLWDWNHWKFKLHVLSWHFVLKKLTNSSLNLTKVKVNTVIRSPRNGVNIFLTKETKMFLKFCWTFLAPTNFPKYVLLKFCPEAVRLFIGKDISENISRLVNEIFRMCNLKFLWFFSI